ncbi:hypothetical protein D0867_05198 [Hortaea werneckii]|uniref:CBM20 domain-containing protein n=1 Tax=Hortaea werneckii TaxID=91943 RepID=A0A3M7B2S5_HORWE|nr:hypothetical protein D0867_05198 [Hortaea werneckii]RMY34082.1 hypothetical protein D0866_05491 [Hortaea werneckii]
MHLTNFSAPSSTETIDYNATSVSLVLSIASLCPVQPSDVETGWTLADLLDSCEDLIEPYCYPALSKPAPTSRDFPAECSPGYYVTTSIDPSSSTVSATNSVLPTQSGIASSCTKYYKAVSGDTCQGISDAYDLLVDAFEDMNPAVGSECKSLWLGYYYCVATSSSSTSTAQPTSESSFPTSQAPQPQQAGIVDNCNKYYKVSSGDYCASIANSHNISTKDFLGWNTGIDPDCGNLFVNNYVCIGVGASSCVVDVAFHTSHSTEWGKAVIVVGSVPALGNWDVNTALSMTGSSGGANGVTNWDVTAELPANTQVAYKFVKVQTDGTPVWESDPNRNVQTTNCGGGAVEQQGGNWHDGSITSCNAVPVSFQVTAQTSFGEAVYVIGSVPALGEWSTDTAVALSAEQYTDSNPLWQGSVRLAIGKDVQYKFIKIGLDGGFTWESDPNRQFTVPTDCYATPLQSGTFEQ